MFKLLLTAIVISFSSACFSQDSLIIEKTPHKNHLMLEIAGNGALFSLSYDRLLFHQEEQKIYGRAGFGFLFNIVFIEGSYVYGKKHCFEQGLSYGHDLTTHWDMYYRLGYRFEGKKGLLLRVAPLLHYNMFSGNTNPFDIWYGVSIGTSL